MKHILKVREINGVVYLHVPQHIAELEGVAGSKLFMASLSPIDVTDERDE